jgi:Protein of unknown function (DUF2950)
MLLIHNTYLIHTRRRMAAEDTGGKQEGKHSQSVNKDERRLEMNSIRNGKTKMWKVLAAEVVILGAGWMAMGCKSTPKPEVSAPAVQSEFASPADAAQALVAAARAGDEAGLARILGKGSQEYLTSGDSAVDKKANADFAAKYDKMNRWVDMTDGTKVLYVGADNFAFPIPLAKDAAGKWQFDTKAGALEVKARDIGRNEMLAMDAVSSVANAQELYYKTHGKEYAQRVISGEGKQDGLYWPVPAGSESSPLGHLSKFPKTSIAAVGDEPPVVDGYTLRILTAQVDEAKGGAKSYVVNGKMTGGFAVLATPVKYDETGVMTFVLSRDGVLYEQDFGPKTVEIAKSIKDYNPKEGWMPVE